MPIALVGLGNCLLIMKDRFSVCSSSVATERLFKRPNNQEAKCKAFELQTRVMVTLYFLHQHLLSLKSMENPNWRDSFEDQNDALYILCVMFCISDNLYVNFK